MAIEVTPEPYVDVWFTFGVQYGADERWNRIVHPVWPPADGDGWLRVRADDYDTARAKGWEITGGRFAFDYLEQPAAEYAPLGELGFVDVTSAALSIGNPS